MTSSIQPSIQKSPPLHPAASQLPPCTCHRVFGTNRPRRTKHDEDSGQQNIAFHSNGPVYSTQRRTRHRRPRICGLPQNPTFLLYDTPSWEGNLLSMQTSKGRRRWPSLLPFWLSSWWRPSICDSYFTHFISQSICNDYFTQQECSQPYSQSPPIRPLFRLLLHLGINQSTIIRFISCDDRRLRVILIPIAYPQSISTQQDQLRT